MNIDEELNKIIFKYHLDQYYPHYRNMYEAEKLIRREINAIIQNHTKVIFVGNDMTEIAFIRNISRDYVDIYFHLYKQNETMSLETVDWKQYDMIYLLSYYGAEYIERWFRVHYINYEWVYDIFERESVFLQRPFLFLEKETLTPMISWKIYQRDNHTGALQCELYCQQNKYYCTKDPMIKRIALEKCLFLALYMKNFVIAKEYAALLIKEDSRYKQAWAEIEDLVCRIKEVVSSRKSEDILLYWLDCIPYGGEKDMPYLQSIMEKSIMFENAYTYVPYTHPTLRALFLGKKEIDDKAYRIKTITKENSSLIQFLEEQGYDIKIISGYFEDYFPIQYQSKQLILGAFEAASVKLWEMISGMLQQKQKTLWVVHLLDAHEPELSCKMNDNNYKNNQIRYKLAKQEVDEQLNFYDDFVNERTFKIYMSDHGNKTMDRYHILFNVYHNEWKPRKIESFFSLLDFKKVLEQIIVNDNIQEKEFGREYVEIGNCDRYNADYIKKIMQGEIPLNQFLFGYKGVIDKEYIYICYQTGKEWLHKRAETFLCEPILFYDGMHDICEPELLPKYRRLTGGEYPKDIIEDEQFRYSRYLYVLYDNILEHNNMHERIDTINQMLCSYPSESVAIRMGGVASSKLYYVLSEENKKKIWGFIDNAEDCLCSKLCLPVVHSDEIADLHKYGVKAILLPSYTYLEVMRKEAERWPVGIDVLDIYEVFNRKGVKCQGEFYSMWGTDKDYDVGFPFDEI